MENGGEEEEEGLLHKSLSLQSVCVCGWVSVSHTADSLVTHLLA